MAEFLDKKINEGYDKQIKAVFNDAFGVPSDRIIVANNRDPRLTDIELRGFDIKKDKSSLDILTKDLGAEVTVENGTTKIKIADFQLEKLMAAQERQMSQAASRQVNRTFSDKEFDQILANLKYEPQASAMKTSVDLTLEDGKSKKHEFNIYTDPSGGSAKRYMKIEPNKDAVAEACGYFLGNRTTKNWSPEQKIGAMMEQLKLPPGTAPTNPSLINSLQVMAQTSVARALADDLIRIPDVARNISISESVQHSADAGKTDYRVKLSESQIQQVESKIRQTFVDEVRRNGMESMLPSGAIIPQGRARTQAIEGGRG